MPLISDSIGRVLGKRYRLVSALGTGASAHVFLAEDVSLQRHVAVKVLQPGLAADDSFLKRFRAEAALGGLAQPPARAARVRLGRGHGRPVPGARISRRGLARDLLDRGVRLSHSQAAAIGTEVAQGLAYAHARGLVHRDIKPANLLFDEEGRVRVADFGVARALAEAAWTEPAGAMVGTARYMSPEAAEGRPVDGRADVYSLAIVLYEAVTGTVPFVTDTTMGTLAARIGQPLPHHPDLGPLDDVLARAAAPDVSTRLDAAGLAARLGALSSALPTPAPLPLVMEHGGTTAPINGFRAPGVAELTEVAAGTATAATAATAANVGPRDGCDRRGDDRARRPRLSGPRRARARSSTPSPMRARAAAWRRGRRVGRRSVAPHGLDRGRRSPRRAGHRGRAGGGVRGQGLHPVPPGAGAGRPQPHRSPVGGVQGPHGRARLGHQGAAPSPSPPATSAQIPAAGSSQKQGSTISVVPSHGPPTVPVPSFTGMTCAVATSTLQAAHLKAVCAPARYNNTIPAGVLICGPSAPRPSRRARPTDLPSPWCPRRATRR